MTASSIHSALAAGQTPEEAQVALDAGFRILACSGELWLFERGLRQGIEAVRALDAG